MNSTNCTDLRQPLQHAGECLDGGPVCSDDVYPKYPPGDYEVRCWRVKVYPDPRFHRKVCRIDCYLMSDPTRNISGFANLANGEVGRGSKYWRWWTVANGSELPKKRQRLSPRIFKDKVFKVRVGDVGPKRADGSQKLEFEVYSLITDVLARLWP